METVTPEEAAQAFLVGYDRATRLGHREVLRTWFVWCYNNAVNPLNARRKHIETWARIQMEIEGVAKRTVATRLSTLAGFYRYCGDERWIDHDPMVGVRRPRLPRASTGSWLTADQLRAILAAAAAHPVPALDALVHILGLSGTRIGETLALDVHDVGRHGQMMTITLCRKGLQGGTQVLSVPAATARAIGRARGDRTEGPLLLNLDGQPMAGPTAAGLIAALGARVGADRKITPHSLRRTFVTLSRDAGVPDRDIMASTGHQTPGMIEYYDRQRAAVERNAGHRLAEWLAHNETPPPTQA